MAKKKYKKNSKPLYFEGASFFYLYDKHIICKLHKNNTGIL